MKLEVRIETWPLKRPQQITGYTFSDAQMIVVELSESGHAGRGEANGVYYLSETPGSMLAQIYGVGSIIEAGITREALRSLLPPGGARNAVDCALWELEACRAGASVWQAAGLEPPRPVLTTRTIYAGTPEAMAREAGLLATAPAIKLKLLGDGMDAERVRAVRAERPDVWLCVDANQGFDRHGFELLSPALREAAVQLIEQPFPTGSDALLDGLARPIPIAADESVQGLSDIAALVGRFDIVNIKLDKCGGLTEALLMVQEARRLGLGVMVGCMPATSLAMAPAFLLGQLCDVADLDGPLYLASDRRQAVDYANSHLFSSEAVWGGRAPTLEAAP